jgi:hypothetical protein
MDPVPDYYKLDDGSERWEVDHKLHRDDGPALILPDGTKCWYRHGLLHRDGGPAVEMAHGTKKWYRNGKRHREDGPAIDTGDPKTSRWYIDDAPLSMEQVAALRSRQNGEAAAQALKEGLPSAIPAVKPFRLG